MNLDSATRQRAQPAGPRLPGVYVEQRTREVRVDGDEARGLPVFIGFARLAEDAGPLPPWGAVRLGRTDAQRFNRMFSCPIGGHLAASIAGYFANGGDACLVMPVEPSDDVDECADRLARVFERGGVLEDLASVSLVCLPDVFHVPGPSPGAIDGATVDRAVRIDDAALDHCRRMGDRFALLDGPPPSSQVGGNEVERALAMATSLRSPWGAMFFPWVRALPLWLPPGSEVAFGGAVQWRCRALTAGVGSGAGHRRGIDMPASGLVCGQYARRDRVVGVQHAPGRALLNSAIDTLVALTVPQCAELNAAGVNPLRLDRAQAGVVVAGARTLRPAGPMAFVSTVRVVAEFRRWLADGLQDLVFEPNSASLRERIRIRLIARCEEMLRAGALVGTSAQQAYFVRCDDELNPPGGEDSGQVVALIGLAPSVPAEFIEVRVIHDANGTTLSEFA